MPMYRLVVGEVSYLDELPLGTGIAIQAGRVADDEWVIPLSQQPQAGLNIHVFVIWKKHRLEADWPILEPPLPVSNTPQSNQAKPGPVW